MDTRHESRPIDVLSPFMSSDSFSLTNPIGVLFLLYAAAIVIPALALTWRRLHDTDRSGAWFFITFIPLIGTLVLVLFTLSRERPSGARFDQ